ncbi:MAG: TIGR02099 family protein [Betaproteobacteria bacterium]|nr:TIGR02099 family protein [Betaproteobacteria bacterium]
MSALHVTVKLATRLLEAAIALVVALYLLLGASLLTLRYAVLPNAQRFVPWLEQESSQALGLPVHIGSVRSRWQGLLPTLSMRDLVIDDAHGHPALRLASVQALPSWKSLPRLQLSFEQLVIRGADLRITREDATHLDIGGIPIDLRAGAGGGQRFADWLFSQDQILVQDSAITWVDKTHDAAPLQLHDVQLELRNTLLHHRAALQAVPPPQLGAALQLRADMRQPLFDRHPGNLAAWQGTLWADLPRVDLDSLGRWVTLPAQLSGGDGALRAWLQVGHDYQPQSVTVVAALGALHAQLDPALPPLQLRELSGRLSWRRLAHGSQLELAGLRLRDADGKLLAPSLLQWRRQQAPGAPAQGSLSVGALDLGELEALAQRLPLPADWRERLLQLRPRGRVDSASLSWSGDWSAARALPQRYALKASFSGLGWNSPAAAASAPAAPAAPAAAGQAQASAALPAGGASTPAQAPALPALLPGIQSLDGSVDANQDGGNARLRMRDGAVALPTVFEAPSLPVSSLDARLSWSRESGGQWDLQGSQIRLVTPDAAGSVNLRYTTQAAGPGLLDLSARLSRAELRAVPKYLPLGIAKDTRDYLRSAIAGGSADEVRFQVQGPLARFPFDQPGSGLFRVDARIHGGVFSPAPRRLLPKGRQASSADVAANALWPEFRDVDGSFSFSSRGMSARGVSARVGKARLQGLELELPSYVHGVLQAQAQVLAPADEALRYVRNSPLDAALGHALSEATASGPLRLQLALSLPLEHTDQARVKGHLQLLDDQLRYLPELPAVKGVRGQVDFSEGGFNMQLQGADFAGGALRVHGGQAPGGALRIEADGRVDAAALRAAPELRAWAPLLRHLHGSTPFALRVDAAPGQSIPRLQLGSSLVGMAIDLPAPLGKNAQTEQALRVVRAAGGDGGDGGDGGAQSWSLDLDGDLRASGLLQAAATGKPAAWRGLSVALGPAAALPSPGQGLHANVDLPLLDLDAWKRALAQSTPAGTTSAADSTAAAGSPAAASPWMPTVLALRVSRLTLDGRVFDDVVLGATRSGPLWQANLRSNQLDGAVNWRMGVGDSPGSVSARLTHLQLPESSDSDVEHLLDERPRSLPAIDLQASDVEIHGHHFDSLRLQAVNRGRGDARQWQLDDVRLSSPDAVFTASGDWSPTSRRAGAPHRMSLGFRLDVADAGSLLARLGKPGLLKGGKGTLQGTLSWLGSPLSLDYPSLSGQFNLALGKGQFLKADPGISKLLGVLSLQSLPRRLTLNFSDVFSSGFAFDKVGADVQLLDGVATTKDFKMSGLTATVFIDGSADLARETQDLYVVVVPDINAGSASLAYALINPAIGLGTFIAQLIAREPLMKALTYGYRVTGTWAKPEVSPQRDPHPPAAGASSPRG